MSAVLLGIVFATTSGFGLVDSLVEGSTRVPLDIGEVAVGRFVVTTPGDTLIGLVVYADANAKPTLDGTLKDVNGTPDMTPATVRDAICGQQPGTCVNTTHPTDALLENMTQATTSLARDLRATLTSNTTASIHSARGSTIVISIVHASDYSPSASSGASSRGLQNVTNVLVEACKTAVSNRVLPTTDCPTSFVHLDVDAMWNTSANAFDGMGDTTEYSVLGPLAWTSHRDVPLQASTEPRMFLPTAAFLAIAVGIVACICIQEFCESRWGNFFLPLPPLGILAGLVMLWWVNHHRAMPHVFWTILLWYAALIAVGLLIYRFLDFAGIQYYSVATTIGALAVATIVLLYQLTRVILRGPDELVPSLLDGGLGANVRAAGVHAVSWGAGFTIAALFANVLVSLHAYHEGRRKLSPADIRQILQTRPASLPDVVRRFDPKNPSRTAADVVSDEAYSSILARAYGALRRHNARVWIMDALWPSSTYPAWMNRIVAQNAAYRNGPRLWRMHKDQSDFTKGSLFP